MTKYVENKTFEAMRDNTDKLINILNHSMTKLATDVGWLKKLLGAQTSLIVGILIVVIVGVIKFAFL